MQGHVMTTIWAKETLLLLVRNLLEEQFRQKPRSTDSTCVFHKSVRSIDLEAAVVSAGVAVIRLE